MFLRVHKLLKYTSEKKERNQRRLIRMITSRFTSTYSTATGKETAFLFIKIKNLIRKVVWFILCEKSLKSKEY